MKVDFDPTQYLDRWGVSNFTSIRKYKLYNDWDHVNVIVGRERSGKSQLGILVCSIVDPDFSVKNIVFPTVELRAAIGRAKPYTAIDQDEGAETWLSDDATGYDSRRMVRSLMEIGFKNLFINVIIPDAGKVSNFLKAHRASSLLRVVGRGRYAYYSGPKLKQIKRDSQTKAIVWPKPNYMGRWKKIPEGSPFWKAYLEKANGWKSGHKDNPKLIEAQMDIEAFQKDTLTFSEASRILGFCSAWLANLHRQGILKKRFGVKPIQIGATLRITYKDFNRIKLGVYGRNLDH